MRRLSLFLVRHFYEGNIYGRPFLELVNLCGMNRFTSEVNSSRKLDHKSSTDRSQSLEWTTESRYLECVQGIVRVEVLFTK